MKNKNKNKSASRLTGLDYLILASVAANLIKAWRKKNKSNEPDGTIIWECIVRALEKAEFPQSKWKSIRKYVQSSMHKDGWKFILG